MYRFYKQLPYTLTYTYNFYFVSDYRVFTPICSHLWSLAVEEQFYLIWPLMVFFTPEKNLKGLLLWLIALGPVWRFCTYQLVNQHLWQITDDRADILIYLLPTSHLDAFAIGGYFAQFRKKIPSIHLGGLLLISVTIVIVSNIFSIPKTPAHGAGFTYFMRDDYAFIWGYSLANFMFAILIVQIKEKAFFNLIFENTFLGYLGIISYGLYVLHYPIQTLFQMSLPNQPMLLVNSLILIVTIIVSSLSFKLLESRVMRLKDRYFAR